MAPQLLVRFNEFTESTTVDPTTTPDGAWKPSTVQGANRQVDTGVTDQWWFCDTQSIQIYQGKPPASDELYSTFSIFYIGGRGLLVLAGDAVNPGTEETWHNLWFEYPKDTLSSSLANAAGHATLHSQHPNAVWPKMLLPSIYRQHQDPPPNVKYRGLTGDLAIFFCLLALSIERDKVAEQLPSTMHNGRWTTQTYDGSHRGWIEKRGVTAFVYTVDGNRDTLAAYENGEHGQSYYTST